MACGLYEATNVERGFWQSKQFHHVVWNMTDSATQSAVVCQKVIPKEFLRSVHEFMTRPLPNFSHVSDCLLV